MQIQWQALIVYGRIFFDYKVTTITEDPVTDPMVFNYKHFALYCFISLEKLDSNFDDDFHEKVCSMANYGFGHTGCALVHLG